MGGRRVIKAVLTYPIQTGRFWSGPGPGGTPLFLNYKC